MSWGVYGNALALDAVSAAFEAEVGGTHLVFNGDFNWFNVDPVLFQRLNERVLCWPATCGNVKTELEATGSAAGCGCAYPAWVNDGVVERSNAIMHRLRQTAARFPDLRAQLTTSPMWQRIGVGATWVVVVHGDACRAATIVMPRAFPWSRGVLLQEPLRICYKRHQASDSKSAEIVKGHAPLMTWCPCAGTRRVCGGYWIISLPQEYVCHPRNIHRLRSWKRPMLSGASY
jgi:hypothetical protein